MENPMTESTVLAADQEELSCWAVVEIFGHTKLAGRVSTRKMGTNVMLQVDVPKGETEFSHSRLYSPGAIFSINPTTEAVCRKLTESSYAYNHKPIEYIPESRPALIDEDDADDDEPLED